jgi:tetratricopeptide (TPR) repeat protein
MRLTREQLARMSHLLDDVIDAGDAERRAWLQALPAEHRDLATALREALLPAQPAMTADLLPRIPAADDTSPASGRRPGDLVGPYRLARPLGAGGMAEVWLAHRADGAFRREVALKMPARKEESVGLARRFAVERDILAGLEHPHIARFYDAGTAEDGTPYLALEYVAGRNLLRWADDHRCTIRARIELFLQVLEAVQYAHDKGVLHRDLKPGNVLVTDAGRVHLLDFGVARWMERPAESALTLLYGPALTPAYASPEQLDGSATAAASDVYSLGVVLHELLSGQQPRAASDPSPSTRVQPGSTATDPPSLCVRAPAAELRGGRLPTVRRALRGDLDAIVLKALARVPSQRYASAAALAQDLRRWLDGETVHAIPASLAYRARKLVSRHRIGMGAATAGLAAVVVGGVGYAMWQRPSAPPPAPATPVVAEAPAAPSPRLQAHRLVMQGDVYANGPFERDAQRAEAAYRQAIARDPAYATPWARLGLLHLRQAELSETERGEYNARARRELDTALRIDPQSMPAHAARFRQAVRVDHRWGDARAELDRMRAIDPGDAVLLPACEAQFAAVIGKLDEAIRIQKQVVERDPQDTAAVAVLAAYLMHADRFEDAVLLHRHVLHVNPHALGSHGLAGVNMALLGHATQGLAEIADERHEPTRLWASAVAHWTAGRRGDADAALAAMRKYDASHAYAIAQLYALRGKRTAAFEWLNRSCAERQGGCEWLRIDRFLRPLRDDPRYRALLVKMQLYGDPPPSTH